MSIRASWVAILIGVGPLAGGAALAAQQPTSRPARPTTCELIPQPTTRFTTDTVPGGGSVVFVGGGVHLRCPERNITLRGDSAERYPDRDFMIGNVVYDEPRFHVTSDFLNHFPAEERVVAVGHVNAKLPNGSTLVGPIAEYFRASPRLRPRDQIRARSRPTITIIEKDSAGRPTPPTTVVAENVFMDGDSLIYAAGQVVITRPDSIPRVPPAAPSAAAPPTPTAMPAAWSEVRGISATADSVFLDEAHETMRLMRKPQLKGTKDRPFTLNGDLIDLFSSNHKLQRVIARANAVAVSDSLTLKSDTIDLRIHNDVLDHAYAWGASRARAISPSQNLLADSIDVSMPAQRVQQIRAIRAAFAEGRPDTTRFHVDKPDSTDWLRGDIIIAQFDSSIAKDTARNPVIRTLTASGHASSLYHMAPNDSAERRPAINYVVARLINIAFDSQRVATVTTVDSVVGVYVEPKADSTARRTNAQPATPAIQPANSPANRPATRPPAGRTPPKPSSVTPPPPKKP